MLFRTHLQQNPCVAEANDVRKYHYWIFVVLLATLAVFVFALLAPAETNIWFIKEGGLIESMSAGAYLFCVVLMLKLGNSVYLKNNWYFLVVLVAFAMRELDFDKRFTEVGILKSKFILSPGDSVTTKITAYLILAFILIALFRIVHRHGLCVAKRLKYGCLTTVDWSLLIAIGFIIFSKTIDGIGRKLADFGIVISQQAGTVFAHLEESLEWAIPLLCIVAVIAFFKETRTPENNVQHS